MRLPGRLILFACLVATNAVSPNPRATAQESPSALDRAPDGWKDLLADAGPELKGWTRRPIPPGATLKAGTPSQWSLDPKTGYLVCRGDGGHDWIRWDQELGDVVYHVEWRFTPVPGKKGYNSGIYARNSADAKVWHQAQTGDASGGFLFGDSPVDGKLQRFNLANHAQGQRVKAAGEWNTFEITCKGKVLSLWVNGAVTSVFKNCEAPRGYVGVEAEGWPIEFRNVKIKALNK